jgi:peptidoglycan hydrolase-like protein with peptidoglycan-binding domain
MNQQIFRLGDLDKPEVAEMQRILNRLGLYPFGIDGDFGYGTYRALIAFQVKMKLTPDGVLGPNTMIELRKVQIKPPKDIFSVENVLEAMKKKGYVIRDAQYKINMVGIRMDDIYDNAFSDKLLVFWVNEKKEWEKREFKWTTMPGTWGFTKGGV